LHNASMRHSGLDPESRKYLIMLDTGLRNLKVIFDRYDKGAGCIGLCKSLTDLTKGLT
jgi:hypothetical protein